MATKTANGKAAKAAESLAVTNALREVGSRFLWSAYPLASRGSLLVYTRKPGDGDATRDVTKFVTLASDASPGPVPFDRAYWGLVEAILKAYPKATAATVVFEAATEAPGQLPVPLYRV